MKTFEAQLGRESGMVGAKHRFRIGLRADKVVEFTAGRYNFGDRLSDGFLDHGLKHVAKPESFVLIQVFCPAGAGWRNLQNPTTGSVVAVSPSIIGNSDSVDTLFDWANNAVNMANALGNLASNLAREASA